MQHAYDVDVDHALKMGGAGFDQRHGAEHAGVVEHHVAAAELGERAIEQRLHGVCASNVGAYTDAAAAKADDLIGESAHTPFVYVGECDVHACARTLQCQSRADATR